MFNHKKINAVQFFILLFLFNILLSVVVHVAVLGSYHSKGDENTNANRDEYTVGDWTILNTRKIKLDSLTKVFFANGSYLDRIYLNITDLPNDRIGYINIRLVHNGLVLYSSNIPLSTISSNEWFPIHCSIHLKDAELYKLVINSKDTNTYPYIYLANDGTPLITFTYKNNLSPLDQVLLIIYYFIICVCVAFVALRYQNIIVWAKTIFINQSVYRWRVGAYTVVNTFLAGFVLCSSLEWKIPDRAFLLFFEICVLVSTLWCENNLLKIKKDFLSIKKLIIYTFLAFYTSFTIVGNKCFIYPINLNVSLGQLFCFIAIAIAVFPLVVSLTHLLECGNKLNAKIKTKNMPWKVYFLCFCMIMFVAMYYIRAFNPASSSPDTVYCMYYAINSIRGITNWHPPFYILWLKVIVNIWNSAYAVVVVQYLWFSFVFLEGCRLLYRRGVSCAWIILITLFSTLNCANMVHLVTIWKDVPFAISVFWLTILIARFTLEDQTHSKFIYLELLLALICTAFMRQNGAVIFFIVIPCLLVYFRKNIRLLLSCVLSIVFFFLIYFPLYSYLDIQKNPGGGQYIGLGQDIMAVYYNNGNLNDEAMHIVNVLSYENMAGYSYDPYYASSSYNLNISKVEFIRAYIDTFLRNPVLMTREIINRQDCVWNLLLGKNGRLDAVNHIGTMDGDTKWNILVPKRQYNIFTELLTVYTSRSVHSSLLNMIEWRSGIWTLFSVFAFVVCVFLKNKHNLWILFLVQLSYVISLMLTTGWSDYRYYWPLTLIGGFGVLLTLTIDKNYSNSPIQNAR